MILAWLDRLSDEQHESERLAARWHRAHVVFIIGTLVLNLCSVLWHWRAAVRHERAADR